MQPELSEFSYGYALTEELVRWSGTVLTAAPYFPSLLAEGQIGYDVRLNRRGVPLFLQFKLSHRMVRNSAIEIRDYALFAAGSEFFRMHLRTGGSLQHRLLLDLEAAGNQVYYAAPAFHLREDLDDAYIGRQVTARSAFISPAWIGPFADRDSHHVAFQFPGPRFVLSGEPTRLRQAFGIDSLGLRLEQQLQDSTTPLRVKLQEVASSMVVVLKRAAADVHRHRGSGKFGLSKFADRVLRLDAFQRERRPAEFVAYVARTFFDSELLLVNRKRSRNR